MTGSRPTAAPLMTGIVNSAIAGLIVLVLINHFLFSGSETARYGLVAALIGAGVLGIVFGTIIGAVVALTDNALPGIVAGAIVLAGIRLIAAGEFSVLNLVMGLIYGALFGWVVASGVARALDAR